MAKKPTIPGGPEFPGHGQSTALYRFFDQQGQLLYVGITAGPWSRWKKHRRDKVWWHEIRFITVEHHADRQAALFAESRAISDERPKYNLAGVPSPSQREKLMSLATPLAIKQSDPLIARCLRATVLLAVAGESSEIYASVYRMGTSDALAALVVGLFLAMVLPGLSILWWTSDPGKVSGQLWALMAIGFVFGALGSLLVSPDPLSMAIGVPFICGATVWGAWRGYYLLAVPAKTESLNPGHLLRILRRRA